MGGEPPESLAGSLSTSTGGTRIQLELGAERAELTVVAQWMGSPPLGVVLECRHDAISSHSGAMVVTGARDLDSAAVIPLPPSDDDLLLEYVRVPPQPDPHGGEDGFTMVLWLSPEALFDDGTDLPPEEYDVPPEQFEPVVSALEWLKRPWKLAAAG